MSSKIILITGASSGIGEATAKALLSEGHTVYAAARRVDKMAHLKDSGAHLLAMDVTDDNAIRLGIDQIIKEQSRIDVLFNNAGFGLYGAVEDISIDDARYQFEVNLFGLARLTQLVLPHMRSQKSGTIINTSSMGGKIYTPLGAWYHATKHAVEGFSDCLRLEVEPFGINVVVIEPGMIATAFGEVLKDPLLETSGQGAYKDMVENMIKATEKAYESGTFGSPPSVIAQVVSKVVNSEKPKTRYVAGQAAQQLMFIRKWGGDRIFDRVIKSTFNQ